MFGTKQILATVVALGMAGIAHAAISVHGSSTAYTTNDKDWLSHTANDINGNGLGSDGFIFFGNFNGTALGGQAWGTDVRQTPSYVTGFTAGAHFLSIADEFSNIAPGYGIIDSPVVLDGTDARSGAAVAGVAGGSPGDSLEILRFTVSGLTDTVRVGILSGNEQTADGRWDPTSITLTQGANSATVGDHSTSPLDIVPGGTNVGWVFFDIDADGEYIISGTRRLAVAAPGASIGGITFDTIPEPASITLLGMGALMVIRRRNG